MRETVKDLLKSTVISIGMAMTIFCLSGVVFDIQNKGLFSLDQYRFTKMIAGCVLVGLGFGIPSIVYRKDNLPMPIRVIIHMGIWLDGRSGIARKGDPDCGNTACTGIYYLVPVHETLSGRSKKNE